MDPVVDILKAEWPAADERMVVAAIDDGVPTVPGGGPVILGDPATPPPPVGDWDNADEGPDTPAAVSEVTAEGIEDDFLTQMYQDQQRQHEERRKKRRVKPHRLPHSPDNPL